MKTNENLDIFDTNLEKNGRVICWLKKIWLMCFIGKWYAFKSMGRKIGLEEKNTEKKPQTKQRNSRVRNSLQRYAKAKSIHEAMQLI